VVKQVFSQFIIPRCLLIYSGFYYILACGGDFHCNESYTSKTRSWDGTIDEKLGSSKIIKGDGFSVGRDMNAARNILIKQLTR